MKRSILVALALFVVYGCATPKVGPFTPANPKACGADPDCGPGFHCAFPAVDTRAICMPGESSIDARNEAP